MRKFLLSAVLTVFAFHGAKAFKIQTRPLPIVGSFNCECGLAQCLCKQGEITISVNLMSERFKDHLKYYSYDSYFGNYFCGDKCISGIGKVTSIKLPYLSVDELEQSTRTASVVYKKSLSFTERISYTIQNTLGDDLKVLARYIPFIEKSEGKSPINAQAEDVLSVVREKSIQASKSRSESMKNDLTMYLLTQMARDFTQRRELFVIDYVNLIDVLSMLNAEGKLYDFIALYLAMKENPKTRNNLVLEKLVHAVMPENKEFLVYSKLYDLKVKAYASEGLPYFTKVEKGILQLRIDESFSKFLEKYFVNDEVKKLMQDIPDKEAVLWKLIYSLIYDALLYSKTGKVVVSSVALVPSETLDVVATYYDAYFTTNEPANTDYEKHLLKLSPNAVNTNDTELQKAQKALLEAKAGGGGIAWYLWLIPIIPIALIFRRRLLRWITRR